MVLKRRTLAQNKKLAKETGMTVAECKALDAQFMRQQKENQKMYKEWEASRKNRKKK